MADFSSTYGSTDLNALRRDLERQRAAIDERLRAIDLVQQMELEKQQLPGLERIPPRAPPVAQADGLTQAVRFAIGHLAGGEFSVPDIEMYLQHSGYELPKAEPRARIAMILQSMRNNGDIVITAQGSGRTPHKYRVAK